MKFLVTCTTVLLVLASNVELAKKGRRRKTDVAAAFEDAHIPMDSNVPAPLGFLRVTNEESGNTLNLGNDIFYGDTYAQTTTIEFNVKPGFFYTLIVVDLDFPATNASYQSPLLQYLLVNIVDQDLEAAVTLAEYLAPNPAPGTGAHRIVYYLFLQKYEIDATIYPNFQTNRRTFPLESFIADNSLRLVAGNFYYVRFPSLEELCAFYNCAPEEDCI